MELRRRRATARTRPAVQQATLPISLPVTPTSAECAALLKSLIKHLLFQRAQIPYLYDELLRGMQAAQQAEAAQSAVNASRRQRRRRAPKSDRRLTKFLSKAEELMAAIDAALCTLGVPRRAFILLGASTARPREAYEVWLPPAAVGPPPAEVSNAAAVGVGQAPPQQQHNAGEAAGQAVAAPAVAASRSKLSRQDRLCLLAMRQVVMANAQLPEGTAHKVPCKVFLLLEGSSSSSSGSGCGPADASSPVSAADVQEGAAAPAPAGFAVKRQFKLSMRKGVHLKLLLGTKEELKPEPAAAPGPLQFTGQEQVESAPAASPVPLQFTGQQHEQQRAEGEDCCTDMETSSSCGEGGDEEPATEHLSQLPDAPSQHAASHGQRPRRPASDTAGSVWYLCKTTVKGLNSGSQDDDAAEGFDGL